MCGNREKRGKKGNEQRRNVDKGRLMTKEEQAIFKNIRDKIFSEQEDLNPKYANLVNKHFWELI